MCSGHCFSGTAWTSSSETLSGSSLGDQQIESTDLCCVFQRFVRCLWLASNVFFASIFFLSHTSGLGATPVSALARPLCICRRQLPCLSGEPQRYLPAERAACGGGACASSEHLLYNPRCWLLWLQTSRTVKTGASFLHARTCLTLGACMGCMGLPSALLQALAALVCFNPRRA